MLVSRKPVCAGLAALLLLLASPFGTRLRAEASRVRILLLVDRSGNADERWRRTVNLNRVHSTLRRNLRKQGLAGRYTIDVFNGSRMSPETVLNYYRNLRTHPSEALVFYANAHGGTDPKRGLFIELGKGKAIRLYRSQLRAAMLDHDPRLAVILTDACAIVDGKKSLNEKAIRAPRRNRSRRHRPGSGTALRYLFFRHRGLVEINGARTGYTAWSTWEKKKRYGNHFTRALCRLLDRPARQVVRSRDGFVSWNGFRQALDRETRRVAADGARFQPIGVRSLARRATSSSARRSSVGRTATSRGIR
jgi:hypothetical protein